MTSEEVCGESDEVFVSLDDKFLAFFRVGKFSSSNRGVSVRMSNKKGGRAGHE